MQGKERHLSSCATVLMIAQPSSSECIMQCRVQHSTFGAVILSAHGTVGCSKRCCIEPAVYHDPPTFGHEHSRKFRRFQGWSPHSCARTTWSAPQHASVPEWYFLWPSSWCTAKQEHSLLLLLCSPDNKPSTGRTAESCMFLIGQSIEKNYFLTCFAPPVMLHKLYMQPYYMLENGYDG